MPKWLIDGTLSKLAKIDKQHEKGEITAREHDTQSRNAIEFALTVERNIVRKRMAKQRERIIGKMR